MPSSLNYLLPVQFRNKRAIRLIDDVTLNASLDWLAHRRFNSALSLFYRYYHDICSDEFKSIILPKACFAPSTRFADSQHPFAVKLVPDHFIRQYGTGTLSQSPSFPTLISVNPSKPSAQTPTPFRCIALSLSSVMQRSFEIHKGCIFLVRPLLAFDCIKKKTKKILSVVGLHVRSENFLNS